jgi:S1-C subfamily serine protease
MAGLQSCPRCRTPFYGRTRRCRTCGHTLPRPRAGLELVAVGLLVALAAILLWVALAPNGSDTAAPPPQSTAPTQPAPPPQSGTPVQSAPPPATADPGGTGDLKQVIAATKPSVVRIDVRLATGTAVGSGFIYSDQGLVITNQHVVQGSTRVIVTNGAGKQFPGDVLHADAATDLALIQVPGLAGTPALRVSSAQHLSEGDRVVAIGSPEGLTNSVSDGIISAVHRDIQVGGQTMKDVIQTTAPISHGSSGGPLVELRTGAVIGVTTAGSEQGSNLGFAITGDTIMMVLKRWGVQ